jgi:hypothetical protein
MARIDALDFFAGGVPASVLFQIATKNILKLMRNNDNAEARSSLPELCFIGLVAYFEAFCRDCFASILNLAPQLIQLLKNRSYEVRIDPMTVIEMKTELSFRLGFLVAEGLDFGTS